MSLEEVKDWKSKLQYLTPLENSDYSKINWLIAEVERLKLLIVTKDMMFKLTNRCAESAENEAKRLRDGLGELIDKPDYTNLSGRIVPEGIVYAIKRLLEEE